LVCLEEEREDEVDADDEADAAAIISGVARGDIGRFNLIKK